jgi:glutamate-1-semialdehyde 2,1-aminomutase
VRFSKTGADVTSAAVRLARAFTGREHVLACGYHGWHDWYVSATGRGRGVPTAVRELTGAFAYNDLASLNAALDRRVACVILEPVAFEPPRAGFLGAVREACDRAGALLVFDEMWTGFRLALGGAQACYDVRADLACFSKAIANGMPLSVLTGRREVMRLLEEDVFFFTTFGGEALSLAAAKATIDILAREDVPMGLAQRGRRLREGVNGLASELGMPYLRCVGMDCRGLVTFGPEAGDPLVAKSLVQQELLRHGVLWSGFHNICHAHGEADIAHVLAAYREAFTVLRDAVARGEVRGRLRGEPVEPVFRRAGEAQPRPLASAAR